MSNEMKIRLAKLIDEAIRMFLEKGDASSREVGDWFLDSNASIVDEFGQTLAERQVRLMVSERMKKVVCIDGSGTQIDLGLEFDVPGVPNAISYSVSSLDGDEIRFVYLDRATEEHFRSHIGLLRAQINADTKRLKQIRTLFEQLEPAFKANPGITAAEAARLTRRSA